MTRYRIKIVAESDPNGPGEWKDITEDLKRDLQGGAKFDGSKWADTVAFLQSYCPAGFQIVQTESTP